MGKLRDAVEAVWLIFSMRRFGKMAKLTADDWEAIQRIHTTASRGKSQQENAAWWAQFQAKYGASPGLQRLAEQESARNDLYRRWYSVTNPEPYEPLKKVRLTDYSEGETTVEHKRYYQVDTATLHSSTAGNAVWHGKDYWRVTYYPTTRERYTDTKDFVIAEFPSEAFPRTVAVQWHDMDLDDATTGPAEPHVCTGRDCARHRHDDASASLYFTHPPVCDGSDESCPVPGHQHHRTVTPDSNVHAGFEVLKARISGNIRELKAYYTAFLDSEEVDAEVQATVAELVAENGITIPPAAIVCGYCNGPHRASYCEHK